MMFPMHVETLPAFSVSLYDLIRIQSTYIPHAANTTTA